MRCPLHLVGVCNMPDLPVLITEPLSCKLSAESCLSLDL